MYGSVISCNGGHHLLPKPKSITDPLSFHFHLLQPSIPPTIFLISSFFSVSHSVEPSSSQPPQHYSLTPYPYHSPNTPHIYRFNKRLLFILNHSSISSSHSHKKQHPHPLTSLYSTHSIKKTKMKATLGNPNQTMYLHPTYSIRTKRKVCSY